MCLFMIGGYASDPDPYYSASVNVYNPVLNVWTRITNLNGKGRKVMETALAPCPGKASGSCVYVAGGFDSAGKSSRPIATVQSFSAHEDAWITEGSNVEGAVGVRHGDSSVPRRPEAVRFVCVWRVYGCWLFDFR